MITPLTDNRKERGMSVEEADQLFQEIAEIKLELVAIAADGDRELAEVAAKYKRMGEERLKEYEDKYARLERYITANPERFQKPRARKTEFGQYGKRDVSNLEIKNPEELLEYLKLHLLKEFYKVTETLNRKAVEKYVREGKSLPGAKIAEGERIRIDVAQELMEKAKAR